VKVSADIGSTDVEGEIEHHPGRGVFERFAEGLDLEGGWGGDGEDGP
jgi:hypothetical protein